MDDFSSKFEEQNDQHHNTTIQEVACKWTIILSSCTNGYIESEIALVGRWVEDQSSRAILKISHHHHIKINN